MPNNKTSNTDYVRFYIHSEGRNPFRVKDLINWSDYGLDGARNLNYHGTVNKVTKTIQFKKEAKRYIEDVFKEQGILAKLTLSRVRLKTINNEVVWVQDDPVYADFERMKIKDNVLSLNFYSNTLMTLLDAHESDDFELERLETIDNKDIDELESRFIEIKGRSIQSVGSFKAVHSSYNVGWFHAIKTELTSSGDTRHSASESKQFDHTGDLDGTHMIYDISKSDAADSVISIKYDIDIEIGNARVNDIERGFYLAITKLVYNDVLARYEYITSYQAVDEPNIIASVIASGNNIQRVQAQGSVIVNTTKDNSIMIRFWCEPWESGARKALKIHKADFEISDVEFFEASPSIRFMFFYDVINRLIQILTGSKNKFVSNFLGRTELGYNEDGEGGLIGFISGLWARNFNKDFKNYKSPVISIKDASESIANCFNLGYGVETIDNEEKLVLEKLEYFYRDEIVGSFPQTINNEEFAVDSKSYYSRLEFGYTKSGGLGDSRGLDEPNDKSQFITPINISKNKFVKTSKVRADEYKFESLRRKPAQKFPDESDSGDEDNWFIDLKRNADPTVKYEQTHWSDRLDSIPKGVHDPDTFRSFLFTPATILRRFANNFNSGLYLYKNKFINFISGSRNVNLEMKFISEAKSYKENENVLIKNIERPIFKNEIIRFTHPWSEQLENLLFGKTKVVINGQERLVPNFNFKMEFKDSKGNIYRGYYLKHEFKDNPTFDFQLANEEII